PPLTWIADRGTRPVNLPQWVPTPCQQRARRGNATLHQLAAEILATVRKDPDRDAPLVRALITAADPQTGQPLSDDEICHELVLFILAGHDTTSTTLAYSLWALGRHSEIQERVFDEVSALGDRPLTPDDVPRLGHTVRVRHEALRLCPPAAGTPRMLTKDVAVDGYRLEAGTMAVVSFYAMHRDPYLWDRPLKFDPDRFLPERHAGSHPRAGNHRPRRPDRIAQGRLPAGHTLHRRRRRAGRCPRSRADVKPAEISLRCAAPLPGPVAHARSG